MSRDQRGFTLIETVVALAILSVSIVVLYQSFAQDLARTRHDANLSDAILLAQSVMARAGSEWALEPGTMSGAWETYHYELKEVPSTASSGDPYTIPAMQVSVSVSWNEFGGARSTSLSTLKFNRQESP